MDASDVKMVRDVETFGWHVMLVAASDHSPELAYTVGLCRTFKHAEIAVLGLPSRTAHEVLNVIGSAVRDGEAFHAGDRTDSILSGYVAAFVEFPRSAYSTYLGYACRFYDGGEFTALQLCWPDAAGRFPWEPGVTEGVRRRQMVST